MKAEHLPFAPCVLLTKAHIVSEFDCGESLLNEFLQRYALQSLQSNSGMTYVSCRGERVVGYYTLAAAEISWPDATNRATKGIARHPIPALRLARLAVAKDCQGLGLGSALLKHALLQSLKVAEIAGVRVVLVDAKHDQAKDFYLKFGFEPSPINPLLLMALIKDIRKSASGSAAQQS